MSSFLNMRSICQEEFCKKGVVKINTLQNSLFEKYSLKIKIVALDKFSEATVCK